MAVEVLAGAAWLSYCFLLRAVDRALFISFFRRFGFILLDSERVLGMDVVALLGAGCLSFFYPDPIADLCFFRSEISRYQLFLDITISRDHVPGGALFGILTI